MADEERRHVGVDEPAQPHVEPREETIERAVRESAQAQRVEPTLETVDPSQRRGLNRELRRRLALLTVAGFVVGALLGVILGFLPGPFELAGQGYHRGNRALEWTLYSIVLGIAVGIVTAVIGGLMLLQREDGRVQRDVERRVPAGEDRPDVSAPPDDPSLPRS
jgi:ABC-type Fe3+ transport system permease subunit